MRKASRAIIFNGSKMLVMQRNKHGSKYVTLVGGRLNDDETIEQALVREVKEETGLEITAHRLVFIEEHPEPYNEQYIFLCSVKSFENIAIQEDSEEGFMNRIDINTHQPFWVDIRSLEGLAFRTPNLLKAIIEGVKRGFPEAPVKL